MKKIIATTIATSLLSGAALAGGFDGPFVQLGIGGSSTWTNVSGSTIESSEFANPVSLDGTSSRGSFNGLVAGGWSQSVGDAGFNLAANIFYVIGNQNAGQKSSSTDAVFQGRNFTYPYSVNESYSSKAENTFGISVEPGWNFTESTLGYVKLAWVNTRVNTNYTLSADGQSLINSNPSSTYNGFGYGIGVKQLLTKNIFLGVDLMGVTYGSKSITAYTFEDGSQMTANAKASQFMGFASLGYKF